MNKDILKNFINGEFVSAKSTEHFELIAPSNNTVAGLSPKSGKEDVEDALNAAANAFISWRTTTPAVRQKILLDLADAIEQRADEIANVQSRNTGQLKHMIKNEEVILSVDQIRFFAGAARLLEGKATAEYLEGHTSSIRREPIGVIAQVTPWNYPFMMAIWKIIPAIAAGNTVVLKPSDTTPESTLLLAKIASEILPKGVFNVILGDATTGALLTSHHIPQMLAITGSINAGRAVAIEAGKNIVRAHLELGGKSPVIVFDDADIKKAADQIAMAGFFNAGQDCTAATRIIVHESIHDNFIHKLVKASKNYGYGRPDDINAHYGAINNAKQLAAIKQLIKNIPSHAKIETGGEFESTGFYLSPTIISGLQQKDELIQSEIFGPVITVQSFKDEIDALNKANDSIYGLASSVWTNSHSRALRCSKELNYGIVWINTHIVSAAEMPHGGFKDSGYGKDLSMYGLEEYTRIKHVMSAID